MNFVFNKVIHLNLPLKYLQGIYVNWSMLGFLSNISNDWYNLGNQTFEFAKSIPLGLKTSKNGQTQQVKRSSQIFYLRSKIKFYDRNIAKYQIKKKDDSYTRRRSAQSGAILCRLRWSKMRMSYYIFKLSNSF